MADEKAGRVRGTVVSAVPLDPQAIQQLAKAELSGEAGMPTGVIRLLRWALADVG